VNAKAVMMEVASKLPIERAERIAKVWNQNFVIPCDIPVMQPFQGLQIFFPKNMSGNDARIPQMGVLGI